MHDAKTLRLLLCDKISAGGNMIYIAAECADVAVVYTFVRLLTFLQCSATP
jgi:hypothetical protein